MACSFSSIAFVVVPASCLLKLPHPTQNYVWEEKQLTLLVKNKVGTTCPQRMGRCYNLWRTGSQPALSTWQNSQGIGVVLTLQSMCSTVAWGSCGNIMRRKNSSSCSLSSTHWPTQGTSQNLTQLRRGTGEDSRGGNVVFCQHKHEGTWWHLYFKLWYGQYNFEIFKKFYQVFNLNPFSY